MAQIRRKGPNKYLISVYEGRDSKGKRKYYNEFFHGSLAEARLRAAELHAARRKKGPSSLAKTLGDYLQEWLNQVKSSVSERTHETYAYHVRKLLPVVGRLQMYGLSAFELQKGLSGLEGSSRTVKGVYGTLKTALRQAVAWGLLQSDPTAGLKTPRVARQERPVLTQEELRRLLEAAKLYKYYLVIRLLALTGARLGEVLGLRWQDLDLEKKTMTIKRAADGKHRREKADTKTYSSKRTIKLDDETASLLAVYRKGRKVVSIKTGELVFSCNGRIIREDAVRRTLRYALKKAGLPHMRVHDLRHTAGSLLLDAGYSFPTVAAFLGHSSPATTAAVYAHAVRKGVSVANIFKDAD